mgnify:CR=1 FL=1
MMAVDNDLSSSSFAKNFRQALTETLVIFLLFVTVVCGRSITSPDYLKVFRKLDLWVWVLLFLGINTVLKQYYPRFDDQLLNASVFSIVYTLMVPLKVEQM